MDLHEYFENTEGLGILATANDKGEVDVALYARPHVIDENTVALIMRERLSHQNLKSNPHAAYMFVEKGPGYKGKRLHLTKIREETNQELIEKMRRRQPEICPAKDDASKYLVHFRIDRVRPLVGETM
ncbi:MAG: pyridoxamine 5'-phosphate oxidase family protein [Sedimentisphaerales bacterium]|nr:pyridoxamine 5'-phosphate oxidase family protein [Sedimentisphaerales bacterium]